MTIHMVRAFHGIAKDKNEMDQIVETSLQRAALWND